MIAGSSEHRNVPGSELGPHHTTVDLPRAVARPQRWRRQVSRKDPRMTTDRVSTSRLLGFTGILQVDKGDLLVQ
jgi:hypothetical protein